MRRKKHFHGHVLILRHAILPTLVLIGAVCAVVMLALRFSLPTPSCDFLLSGFSQTVLAFDSGQKTSFRLSGYDILEDSILSIKASSAMQKKYAAKYGGIIKQEISKPQKQEDVLLGNILETDASTDSITFINTPKVSVDANTLLQTPLAFSAPTGAPQVLIVHTHTSEAYAESPNARSEDPDYNVVGVGRAIEKALNASGIGVIHDTTQNDNPSYNQSYKKALTVIEKNIAAYPTLEIVLDIHRDYIKRDDGTLVKPTVTTKSGKKAAQIMFVMGTDSMDLYHPEWRHNLAFAANIQQELIKTQPGLCRSINIRTERFNQHATKGSMIIEVGTGANTYDEAVLSGKLVGEAIAAVLKKQ